MCIPKYVDNARFCMHTKQRVAVVQLYDVWFTPWQHGEDSSCTSFVDEEYRSLLGTGMDVFQFGMYTEVYLHFFVRGVRHFFLAEGVHLRMVIKYICV